MDMSHIFVVREVMQLYVHTGMLSLQFIVVVFMEM